LAGNFSRRAAAGRPRLDGVSRTVTAVRLKRRFSQRGLAMAASLIAIVAFSSPAKSADSAVALYRQHCARCHGVDGATDGAADDGYVNDSALPSHSLRDCSWMSLMSDATLFLAIKSGGGAVGIRSSMPAFGDRLTNDEIAGLVSYIRGFCALSNRQSDSGMDASMRR
jgi:mono/diheme cytochrome c family protein